MYAHALSYDIKFGGNKSAFFVSTAKCQINFPPILPAIRYVRYYTSQPGANRATCVLEDCGPFHLTRGDGGPSAEYEHEFGRVWEVDQGEDQIVDVQGRLCKNIAFWEHELKATHPLLECIREGYKLPLLRVPRVFYKDNAKSATEKSEFVTDAIIELCKSRCIQKVES